MKNRGLIIFTIVLLIICSIILSGILVVSLSSRSFMGMRGLFRIQNVSNTKIYDQVYDDVFKSINIDTNAANIKIKKGKENKVLIYGDEKALTISESEDFSINYEAELCKFFCISNPNAAKIEIYLNDSFNGSIEINNKFGDIEIDEFTNSDIKIDSAYGDTIVDGGLNVSLSSDCGNIDVGEAVNLTVDNNFGDIRVNIISNKASINADCGNIDIKEIDIKEDSHIENHMGNIRIDKTNDILIDSKVSLGDNEVNNSNYKSDIVLKIINNCGDIRVN